MSEFKTYGIDVSKWQGKVDWKKVKADGVQFAILRAGYGRVATQKDETFEDNYKGCKAVGMPCGIYWYSYAVTEEEAKKEAAVCLEVIKGKQFEYPIYFDLEEKKQLALGKSACTAIAKAFLETVEKAGYWVGLYMSKSHLESHISEELRERYAIWVAHYGVKATSYKGQFGMWQKSSTGKVDGIEGNVDLNECYIDYPTEIKKAGLNGFKKSTVSEKETVTPPIPAKPLKAEKPAEPEYIDYTVKHGDTLWGIAVKYLGRGSRYKEIMYATGITTTTIFPKQKLKIPKK